MFGFNISYGTTPILIIEMGGGSYYTVDQNLFAGFFTTYSTTHTLVRMEGWGCYAVSPKCWILFNIQYYPHSNASWGEGRPLYIYLSYFCTKLEILLFCTKYMKTLYFCSKYIKILYFCTHFIEFLYLCTKCLKKINMFVQNIQKCYIFVQNR